MRGVNTGVNPLLTDLSCRVCTMKTQQACITYGMQGGKGVNVTINNPPYIWRCAKHTTAQFAAPRTASCLSYIVLAPLDHSRLSSRVKVVVVGWCLLFLIRHTRGEPLRRWHCCGISASCNSPSHGWLPIWRRNLRADGPHTLARGLRRGERWPASQLLRAAVAVVVAASVAIACRHLGVRSRAAVLGPPSRLQRRLRRPSLPRRVCSAPG